MQHYLIEEKPTKLLDEFLETYLATQEKDFDIDYIKRLIKYYFQYHNANAVVLKDRYAEHLQKVLRLEDEWYKSNCTNFDVYDDDYYFIDIWLCFVIFSRKYLRSLVKEKQIGSIHRVSFLDISKNVRTVLDLGCGIAYSTASLKQIYPNAIVTGTNIKDTKQWKFCKYMANKYDFRLEADVKNLQNEQDLVFASEYFEHIINPIEHLDEVLALNPKMLVLANAFNTKALGHFLTYKHEGENIDQKDISKMFNNHLKDNGYKKLKTKFWNNRPNVWVKQ